jgi:hypothetical protein
VSHESGDDDEEYASSFEDSEEEKGEESSDDSSDSDSEVESEANTVSEEEWETPKRKRTRRMSRGWHR